MRSATWLFILLGAGCGDAGYYGGSDSTGGDRTSGGGSQGGAGGGTLTAGAWDDNLDFDYYQRYLQASGALAGAPDIPRGDRMQIRVTDGAGRPIPAAAVTVARGGEVLFAAPTGGEGGVLFFPAWAGADGADLTITAARGGASRTVAAHAGDPSLAIALDGAAAPPASLDVALVLDTTGSMGDEIAYLSDELQHIAGAIADRFPSVAMRWALVVYRDDGDDYVVRSFDFTGDLAAFRATLAAQQANGGGDYPESPERGLAEAAKLSWRSEARVAFWVADAPHHDARAPLMVDAFAAARAAGVHLYPVSASGGNALLEFTMRTGAEVTGGRYLFLTDDSGIGDHHAEPTLPCYLVTRLDAAMVRMAAIELTGYRIAPDPADVLRASGDPSGGVCTLDDGSKVLAF